MGRERFQHNERRIGRFYDQHGRAWEASVENATGHPCGPLKPLFDAPLTPPDVYLEVHPVEPGRLNIAYDRWLEHADTNLLAYQTRIEAIARALHPTDADKYCATPTPEMRRAAGAAPEPREPIVAAMRGQSRWVLGLPDERTGQPLPMPAWAVPFFGEKARKAKEEVFDDTPAFTDAAADEDDGADEAPLGDEFPPPAIFAGMHHEQAKKLVRAIELPEVLDAYEQAELERQPPRPNVLTAIEQRREALAATV
jgi:hypothetical protein